MSEQQLRYDAMCEARSLKDELINKIHEAKRLGLKRTLEDLEEAYLQAGKKYLQLSEDYVNYSNQIKAEWDAKCPKCGGQGYFMESYDGDNDGSMSSGYGGGSYEVVCSCEYGKTLAAIQKKGRKSWRKIEIIQDLKAHKDE